MSAISPAAHGEQILPLQRAAGNLSLIQ